MDTLNVQNFVNSTKNYVHLMKNGYDECTKLSKFNKKLSTFDKQIVWILREIWVHWSHRIVYILGKMKKLNV